jgi:hypothetical protein
MTLTPALRRITFTTHVTSSVGWVGAVFVFLALAAIGLTSEDEVTVRGAYLVMAPAAWFVLVPLAHASLLSGIALSLGTTWGLFRHHWVALKLLITAFSTAILLVYMATFREMAGVASDPAADLGLVRNPSPMVHAILALVLLAAATVLAVYKPFGMTAYGRRKEGLTDGRAPAISQRSRTAVSHAVPAKPTRWMWIVAVVVVALFVLLHMMGRGLGGH